MGRVLPLQGNQHIGKGGGLSHDLFDLLLQVLGLATLQEQIALDPSTSVGLAGQSEKPAKILSELAEVLACELRQVHHDLGGGNSLSLLRPATPRRRVFFFIFFFFPLGFSGSSGSSSSEGKAEGSSSEGSPPRSLET